MFPLSVPLRAFELVPLSTLEEFDPDLLVVGTEKGTVEVVGWVGNTEEVTTLPGVPAGLIGTGTVVVGTTTGST